MLKTKSNKQWKIVGITWVAAFLLSIGIALPQAGYASEAGATGLSVEIGDEFTVQLPTEIEVTMLAAEFNTVVTSTVNVNVNSNDPAGWSMTISMIDTDTSDGALIHESLTSSVARIPASTGTLTNPSILTQNSWGYNINSFAAGTFAQVPAATTPDLIANETGSGNFDFPIQIGVWAGFVPTGVYSNSITLLVTAN
ncbi:hypothetical protein FWH13_01195 [Candidatus Saccharibacteria bacterium]|nr:hypothetical protein [Candidatus Saccharibacteria bacterium]